ncbi:1,4-dihydroxy-6-naphthoate synthase [Engelhardtia mirabilis]|uniref:1,4-dihydroxy-6-naphtoate synthase n=1 Tax=Engelhardtia mirabilis TaxID=2528011 RepID=A0A518BN43_9BACT|nr:1,4-dihydroxy-6-naphtoate synthase [Planctomycetes bacterium Pla133]QDV02723.1 1,4-dihydroxy-6-naphtoate synthase [Planctomycetes bacterium Pla86]
MRRLSIGISTCPNDTFAFHALLTGAVRVDGVQLDFELGDVQELNQRAAAGDLDVAKISYAAALELAAQRVMLPAGSALGFGVGPVVLAGPHPHASPPRVLCPGGQTTATLLWRLFHPETVRLDQVVFSAIMPALRDGSADLGVCIHEGRFTHRDWNLELVEDLGATWERETASPLPLGGISVRRSLPAEVIAAVAEGVRESVEWARANPDACLATMRAHAQEHTDEVLWKHVELYVNDWTVDLGPVGRGAIAELARRARAVGLGQGESIVVD